jgi:hypothetical protein
VFFDSRNLMRQQQLHGAMVTLRGLVNQLFKGSFQFG